MSLEKIRKVKKIEYSEIEELKKKADKVVISYTQYCNGLHGIFRKVEIYVDNTLYLWCG